MALSLRRRQAHPRADEVCAAEDPKPDVLCDGDCYDGLGAHGGGDFENETMGG